MDHTSERNDVEQQHLRRKIWRIARRGVNMAELICHFRCRPCRSLTHLNASPLSGPCRRLPRKTKLTEVGEDVGSPTNPNAPVWFRAFDFLPWRRKLWAGTEHAFGYLPRSCRAVAQSRSSAREPSVPTTRSRAARVRVTLDRLHIEQYPGGGTHLVLFDFSARNFTANEAGELHFNATYRVREGRSATGSLVTRSSLGCRLETRGWPCVVTRST